MIIIKQREWDVSMYIFSPQGTAISYFYTFLFFLKGEVRNGNLDTAVALLVDDPKAVKIWTPTSDD